MNIGNFFQLLVSGLAMGSLYGLIALGHVLIWNAMGVLNFAHSEMVMLGAFLGLTFHVMLGLPYWLTLILVLLCGCVIGSFIQRVVYRYLFIKKVTRESFVIASIGIQVIFINMANIIWGTKNTAFPDIFQSRMVNIAGTVIPMRSFYILGTALILTVLLNILLKKTKIGTGMRAVAQDRETAAAVGINVNMTNMLTFTMAASLGCIAGLLMAPIYMVAASMGQSIALKAFAAAVIGGFSSLAGAIIGGLFMGASETIVAGILGSSFKDIASFVILLLVLYIKPTGLLGKKQ